MAWTIHAPQGGAAWRVVVGAAVAVAAPAFGQVEFQLRGAIALGWGDRAEQVTAPLMITRPGRYDFELQAGVFHAEGFTNYGFANWIGRITASEPGLSQPERPRVAPFNNPIGRDGVPSEDGMRLGAGPNGYIDASVGPLGFTYVQSPPLPPDPHGADELVAVYRFSLTITDMTPREISLTAESLPQAAYTPIASWQVVRDIPPDPGSGEPGYIEYVPVLVPPQFAQRMSTISATIQVVPGPGVPALVMIGAAACIRRRR